MSATRRIALLALVLAWGASALTWGAAALAQDRSVEVYSPLHRLAAELLPLATTVLGDEGRAAVDEGTNALVLIGTPVAVARTLDLLRSQDVARRTIVLRYESRRRDELAAAGIRVDWSLGAGGLRVGSVVVPARREGMRVLSSARAREETGGFRGMVRVQDGQTAHIRSGSSVPVRTLDEVVFVEGQRGFAARPRVLADGRVRVELEPVDAEVDALGRTRFTVASTILTVRPGETVAVGEVARRTEGGEIGTRALDSRRSEEERILLLTVELPEDEAPGGVQ